jgi:hypothetical protein
VLTLSLKYCIVRESQTTTKGEQNTVTQAAAPPINTSAKGRVRVAVEEVLDSVDDLQMPVLVQQIIEQVDTDQKWRRQLLEDGLRPLIYEIVQRGVARRRGMILYGSEIMNMERFEQRVRERASRFDTWLETVGDGTNRRTIRLMRMTRLDLRNAAYQRRKAGTTDLTLAALFEAMARKMPDDDTTVEHVYTAATIAEMEAAIQKHVAISGAVDQMVDEAAAAGVVVTGNTE